MRRSLIFNKQAYAGLNQYAGQMLNGGGTGIGYGDHYYSALQPITPDEFVDSIEQYVSSHAFVTELKGSKYFKINVNYDSKDVLINVYVYHDEKDDPGTINIFIPGKIEAYLMMRLIVYTVGISKQASSSGTAVISSLYMDYITTTASGQNSINALSKPSDFLMRFAINFATIYNCANIRLADDSHVHCGEYATNFPKTDQKNNEFIDFKLYRLLTGKKPLYEEYGFYLRNLDENQRRERDSEIKKLHTFDMNPIYDEIKVVGNNIDDVMKILNAQDDENSPTKNELINIISIFNTKYEEYKALVKSQQILLPGFAKFIYGTEPIGKTCYQYNQIINLLVPSFKQGESKMKQLFPGVYTELNEKYKIPKLLELQNIIKNVMIGSGKYILPINTRISDDGIQLKELAAKIFVNDKKITELRTRLDETKEKSGIIDIEEKIAEMKRQIKKISKEKEIGNIENEIAKLIDANIANTQEEQKLRYVKK